MWSRRTPNKYLVRQRRRGTQHILWVAVVALVLVIAGAAYALRNWEGHMADRRLAGMLAALGLASAVTSVADAGLPVPPTTIGLNISPPNPFRRARAFANLAVGGSWQSQQPKSPAVGPDSVDKRGNLKQLPDGKPAFRILSQPTSDTKEASIRCTYDGRGSIRPSGKGARDVRMEQGGFSFHWVNGGSYNDSLVMVTVSALDPADPIRNLDCRETTMPRAARFDPAFLEMLRGFKILRFMDWQNVNNNAPVTWATRHSEGALDVNNADGVPIEDMLALVKQTGAIPWFNMPWNADDDYVERFARLVHDSLPPDRIVYVEEGNEVWNARFPVSKQALQEGLAENLSAKTEEARLFRYAEKLQRAMDIWAKVFADRPSRLVRVANCQNWALRAQMVLTYKNTYKHIDALATAPYFGVDFRSNPPASPDEAFPRLEASMDQVLGNALEAKAVAAKFGKRYIAYEAGQHIILNDVELASQVQRDPRMYDAYRRYLSLWKSQIGDTLMMYTSVQPVVQWGGWGLLEFSGQPLSEAPKMRAVRDALKGD
jgi:hypothetical protein